METDTRRLRQVNEILLAALGRPPEEQPAFLDEACGEDSALRREVESLLADDGAAAGDLSRPAFEAGGSGPAFGEGDRIGSYRVVAKLGQGGMGEVYLAERADGEFDRQVAIKVLKPGTATAELARRFRVERQILANLEHPGIAMLHEGGTTQNAQPYLVMEYVEGEPIDRYCKTRGLSIDQRLRLVATVCPAVAFAHRNLVVHRDIKPSNILVTPAGEPKLLDFGIAKLLDAQTRQPVTMTEVGTRPMTPDYASPEQVCGEPVTTASDVYALGLLLYELLAGHRPFRFESYRYEEVRRVVCETEPVRPSAAARTGDAEARGRARLLAGDLDNIVMMAIAKEPHERYGSVEQLAADLERYLAGLPVRASRSTFAYRARKFLRRRKREVAVAALAAAGLTGFAVDRDLQQRRTARERDRAERVTELLVDLFEVSDPNAAAGGTVTAREILDRGAEKVREELGDEPEVQAALMVALGRVYRNLGIYDEAKPLIEQALTLRRRLHGSAHVDVAGSLSALGELLYLTGEYAEAERVFRDSLTMYQELLGPDHPDIAKALGNLAVTAQLRSDVDAAEALLRQALAMQRRLFTEEHPDVARTLNNLAVLLQNEKHDLEGAEPLFRRSLEIKRRLHGDDHPDVALALNNLALLVQDKKDFEAAESLYRESLEIARRAYGDEHPHIAGTLSNLGVLSAEQGDFEAAESYFRQGYEMRLELLGPQHPDLAPAATGLARILLMRGDHEGAEPLLRGALDSLRESHPEGHTNAYFIAGLLGTSLMRQARFAEAEPLVSESCQGWAAAGVERQSERCRELLAELYETWGKPEKAAELRRP